MKVPSLNVEQAAWGQFINTKAFFAYSLFRLRLRLFNLNLEFGCLYLYLLMFASNALLPFVYLTSPRSCPHLHWLLIHFSPSHSFLLSRIGLFWLKLGPISLAERMAAERKREDSRKRTNEQVSPFSITELDYSCGTSQFRCSLSWTLKQWIKSISLRMNVTPSLSLTLTQMQCYLCVMTCLTSTVVLCKKQVTQTKSNRIAR